MGQHHNNTFPNKGVIPGKIVENCDFNANIVLLRRESENTKRIKNSFNADF